MMMMIRRRSFFAVCEFDVLRVRAIDHEGDVVSTGAFIFLEIKYHLLNNAVEPDQARSGSTILSS